MTNDKRDELRALYEASLASIKEMTEALDKAQSDGDSDAEEEARQHIEEDALSVEVRGPWFCPGGDGDPGKPTEYRICITTGGPAVQIVGDLSEYGEPESAHLEVQDWFQPWTRFLCTDEDRAALETYARCFYFGEG